jgi:hypothetical protein
VHRINAAANGAARRGDLRERELAHERERGGDVVEHGPDGAAS